MAHTRHNGPSCGNLPAPATSFVGRRNELEQVRAAIRQSRLVTLTGPAGVGKTRLALRLGAEIRREFADGVWLVELSALQDGRLLDTAVAQALRLGDQSARPVPEVLAEFLQDSELLLVLDTCEHLVADCARLVDMLLRHSPLLRVLVTTRQPLGLPGEHVLRVAPMAVESGGDAMELLAVRAAEAAPGFAVDAHNRDAVAELCRHLDGIPLALELAAVRMRALSVDQLLERMSSRLGLRHTKGATSEIRHRTLRTAVGWSHELCAPRERLLWARLSVFPGDFGQEAAVFVCSDAELFGEEVLDALTGLVEKSVVRRHKGRFLLLDTIREYGTEWLARIGEEETLRRRHTDYFRHLAHTAEREWLGPDQVRWRDRLADEHANLRRALDFCIGRGDGSAVELAGALWFFWHACGFAREGRHYLELALATDTGTDPHRARALWAYALVARSQGDHETGARAGAAALALAERAGAPEAAAMARYAIGSCLAVSGDHAGAARFLTEALEVQGLADVPQVRLLNLAGLSYARLGLGEIAAAGALADEVRAGCEEYGERWLKGYADCFAGLAALAQGDPATAAARGRDCLRAKRLLRDSPGIAVAVDLLAAAASATGAAERAARLLGFGQRVWESHGMPQMGAPALTAARRRSEEQALAALTEEAYRAAYQAGLTFPTLDDGIAYAMGTDSVPKNDPAARSGPGAPPDGPGSGADNGTPPSSGDRQPPDQ